MRVDKDSIGLAKLSIRVFKWIRSRPTLEASNGIKVERLESVCIPFMVNSPLWYPLMLLVPELYPFRVMVFPLCFRLSRFTKMESRLKDCIWILSPFQCSERSLANST